MLPCCRPCKLILNETAAVHRALPVDTCPAEPWVVCRSHSLFFMRATRAGSAWRGHLITPQPQAGPGSYGVDSKASRCLGECGHFLLWGRWSWVGCLTRVSCPAH